MNGAHMVGAFAEACTPDVVRRSLLRSALAGVPDGLSFSEIVRRIKPLGLWANRRVLRRDLVAIGARRYAVDGRSVYRVLA